MKPRDLREPKGSGPTFAEATLMLGGRAELDHVAAGSTRGRLSNWETNQQRVPWAVIGEILWARLQRGEPLARKTSADDRLTADWGALMSDTIGQQAFANLALVFRNRHTNAITETAWQGVLEALIRWAEIVKETAPADTERRSPPERRATTPSSSA